MQQELNTELDDVRSEASLSRQAADTAPHFFWTQILQTLEGIARPVAAESIGPRHAGHSSVSSSRCVLDAHVSRCCALNRAVPDWHIAFEVAKPVL